MPGVANAAIWGANPQEIMVEGNPALMRAHAVTLDQLMTAAADAVDTGELGYTTGAAVGSLGFVETPAQQLDVADIQPIHTPAAAGPGAAGNRQRQADHHRPGGRGDVGLPDRRPATPWSTAARA